MKPTTKAKIKGAVHIAPRQPTIKSMIGSYISGVVVLLTQFGRGELTLEGLLITAILMAVPLISSYFGLPTSSDTGFKVAQLAATVIETIRGSSMDDNERKKLEMIIMLSVGEWDTINTMLESFKEKNNYVDEEEEEIT